MHLHLDIAYQRELSAPSPSTVLHSRNLTGTCSCIHQSMLLMNATVNMNTCLLLQAYEVGAAAIQFKIEVAISITEGSNATADASSSLQGTDGPKVRLADHHLRGAGSLLGVP